MYNYRQFRDHVVAPTLLDFNLWSRSAELLLMGTVAAESKGGHYLKQVRGPALGAYQIEPNTHDDVWDNHLRYRSWRRLQVENRLGYSRQPKHSRLVTDLTYSTLIARLIYLRAPQPLPHEDDLPGLARYWKSHYNTYLGAGTPAHFLSALSRWQNERN